MANEPGMTEQPTGLLDYIAGQPGTAVIEDRVVSPNLSVSPETPVSAESVENAPGASEEQVQTGVTNQTPALSPDDLLRLRQENERLQSERERQAEALMLLGIQSGQREKELFEKSIEHLDPEDQEAAREKRRIQALEAQNRWLTQTMDAQRRQAEAAQESIDKGHFAQMVHQRMGLPNDPAIFGLLMESQSPAELVVRAQSLTRFYQQTAVQQQQQIANAARQAGVHVAGGETAPAKPQDKVPLRSNDLIGMMRERQYEAV